jgi:hypothetical protein
MLPSDKAQEGISKTLGPGTLTIEELKGAVYPEVLNLHGGERCQFALFRQSPL